MLEAHHVTSMANTDIDAVKKRKNAERIKQYRLKHKLLTSTETELVEKEKKAEYHKQYRLKRKLQMQPNLRHIHDPVLSSLKMKGIHLLFVG
jgi:hypothetical protein